MLKNKICLMVVGATFLLATALQAKDAKPLSEESFDESVRLLSKSGQYINYLAISSRKYPTPFAFVQTLSAPRVRKLLDEIDGFGRSDKTYAKCEAVFNQTFTEYKTVINAALKHYEVPGTPPNKKSLSSRLQAVCASILCFAQLGYTDAVLEKLETVDAFLDETKKRVAANEKVFPDHFGELIQYFIRPDNNYKLNVLLYSCSKNDPAKCQKIVKELKIPSERLAFADWQTASPLKDQLLQQRPIDPVRMVVVYDWPKSVGDDPAKQKALLKRLEKRLKPTDGTDYAPPHGTESNSPYRTESASPYGQVPVVPPTTGPRCKYSVPTTTPPLTMNSTSRYVYVPLGPLATASFEKALSMRHITYACGVWPRKEKLQGALPSNRIPKNTIKQVEGLLARVIKKEIQPAKGDWKSSKWLGLPEFRLGSDFIIGQFTSKSTDVKKIKFQATDRDIYLTFYSDTLFPHEIDKTNDAQVAAFLTSVLNLPEEAVHKMMIQRSTGKFGKEKTPICFGRLLCPTDQWWRAIPFWITKERGFVSVPTLSVKELSMRSAGVSRFPFKGLKRPSLKYAPPRPFLHGAAPSNPIYQAPVLPTYTPTPQPVPAIPPSAWVPHQR